MAFMFWFVSMLLLAIAHSERIHSRTEFTLTSTACSKGQSDCFDKDVRPAFPNSIRVDCPGSNNHTCAEGYTCCQSPTGDYACCPHVDAVCCSDNIHCCPKGSSCDSGRCKKNTLSINSPDEVKPNCPGDEFHCPLKTTCCKVSGGQFGCCPFEEGTCCADQLHCCPQGFDCGTGDVCLHATNSNISFSIFDLH